MVAVVVAAVVGVVCSSSSSKRRSCSSGTSLRFTRWTSGCAGGGHSEFNPLNFLFFLQVDSDLQKDPNIDAELSGTTAVVALVRWTKNGRGTVRTVERRERKRERERE